MLDYLVAGRERSAVLCIEDTVLQDGSALTYCFIEGLLKRVDEVQLICFDQPPNSLQSSKRLQIHDGFSDTFGWLGSSRGLDVNMDLSAFIATRSRALPGQKTAVVVSSITPLLLQLGAVKTCQIIHQLSTTVLKGGEIVQVLFLLHSDLHDDHSLSLIHHVTSTIVKVCPSKSSSHVAMCSMIHKKPSGKVVKTSEHFNINLSLEVADVEEVKSSAISSAEIPQHEPDPTANLTFNLSLTDKEKQARSQLVLPYTTVMEKANQESPHLRAPIEGGKIFYQPDDADDFDEEDPDDDLDI